MNAAKQVSLQTVAAVVQSARQVVHVSASQTHPGTGVWPQPVAGEHASVVHRFPSSQSGGAPPVHWPAAHWSPVVHALPSSHGPLVSVWTQTPALQASVVHALPSSQRSAAPTQRPAVHASPVVHAFASSQAAPSGRVGFEHAPVAGSQVPAAWQWSDATHVTGVPATHVPLSHRSPCVHPLPSLQAVPSAASRHVAVQHGPPSHASLPSRIPSPQVSGSHASPIPSPSRSP